jgi:hypothetical protein
MVVLAFGAFGSALALSGYAIWSSIAPNLDRITEALYGRAPATFQPLSGLVLAERRITVRRWAAVSRPVAMREAA